MKLGVCCGLAEAREVALLGYDYVEVPATHVAEATNTEPLKWLCIESTNLFFPNHWKLYQEPWEKIDNYAYDLFEKAFALGIKTMVIGGGSPRAADGLLPVEEAEAKFIEIVVKLQELASDADIKLAPESLNHAETDVWNDLPALAEALEEKGVGFTADLYHILYENPEPGDLTELMRQQIPFAPAHVHLANRARALAIKGDPEVDAFVARLRELNCDGRVSIESVNKDYAAGLATLKTLFSQTCPL